MRRPEDFLSLAADRRPEARGDLFRAISDVLLNSSAPVSERERAEAGAILENLLGEVETALRVELAGRLAQRNDVPRELVRALAGDEISVAQPVLLSSPLLGEDDLVQLVRLRSREHRLAIATRPGIAETVCDALIESGEELVVEALIRNKDARLSQSAIAFLVAESQRVDRFREPLLRRSDLPTALAYRMFQWVSAELRGEILRRFEVDPALLDHDLNAAVQSAAEVPPQDDALGLARKLVQRARAQGLLNERFVLQNLRAGHVAVAGAALADLAGIEAIEARRLLLDADRQPLAICCRAAGLPASAAVTLIALTAQAAHAALPPLDGDGVASIYQRMSPAQARAVLRFWRTRDAQSGTQVA